MDNKPATITQGLQIPVVINNGLQGITTQFVNAALQLAVTPHVTADGSVFDGRQHHQQLTERRDGFLWCSVRIHESRNHPNVDQRRRYRGHWRYLPTVGKERHAGNSFPFQNSHPGLAV